MVVRGQGNLAVQVLAERVARTDCFHCLLPHGKEMVPPDLPVLDLGEPGGSFQAVDLEGVLAMAHVVGKVVVPKRNR